MSRRTRSKLPPRSAGRSTNPFTGATFTVNPTGLCVLQALKEGLGRKEIDLRLKDRFDVRASDPARDVDEFVHLLRQHGIVPGDFAL